MLVVIAFFSLSIGGDLGDIMSLLQDNMLSLYCAMWGIFFITLSKSPSQKRFDGLITGQAVEIGEQYQQGKIV